MKTSASNCRRTTNFDYCATSNVRDESPLNDREGAREFNFMRQREVDPTPRSGKVLILVLMAFPMILGIIGLVIDGSLLLHDSRSTQHVADAAATTAAFSASQGDPPIFAGQKAQEMVRNFNAMESAAIQVHSPPISGAYRGRSNFYEVNVSNETDTLFMHLTNRFASRGVRARAVAGIKDATPPLSVVVLDPNPDPITITGLPLTLPSLPNHHLGGMEVLGLGRVRVSGGIAINNDWGGVDEHGDPVGENRLLRSALTCTPLLPLTKLNAEHIRVVGGVDNYKNYGHIDGTDANSLRANMGPAPDPFQELPVPTITEDPANVDETYRGSVDILNLPILSPTVVLEPGVYDYINVITGPVRFEPGVYIIRGQHPITGIPLSVLAGPINGRGVMFYISENATYSPTSGLPDSGEDSSTPPTSNLRALLPTAVINGAVLGVKFTPLSDPSSPYDGMFIFQNRNNRRPMVLVTEQLLGSGTLAGTIYSKWGSVVLVANGTHDLGFVVGSIRIVTALGLRLNPSLKFPPVKEVFLVE
ncbi:pilus assembly protein TadG-related protein [Thalassoglobus polymorphus]|uniref:Putative Flp pilus-assembly TadG-like N-terminal domain-containing protein n=1 Tax=Thalassoglobus polymorphus TaxID=2527994 RepID=A0A517QRB6_9PLAN|nr:pilus assembly protein TadG-related protein [Thalassoglobus polymorphus]QDT34172.1 hypothetical protein Mal48_34320 [Thalassoglobus polymorphus]